MELSHVRLTALRSVTKLSSHELSFNTFKTISPLYRPAMSSQLLVHKTLKLWTKHQNAYREITVPTTLLLSRMRTYNPQEGRLVHPPPSWRNPQHVPPGSPPTVRTCRVMLWNLQASQVLRLWSAWTKCPVHNVALQYVVSQQAAKLQRAVGSKSTRWQWEMGRPTRAETRGGARAWTDPGPWHLSPWEMIWWRSWNTPTSGQPESNHTKVDVYYLNSSWEKTKISELKMKNINTLICITCAWTL